MALSSHEVRWFFAGPVEQHPALKNWVEKITPIGQETPVSPQWEGRIDGKPDIYLLIPGHADMGIKWREGQLQIKGLQSSIGTQLFSSRAVGKVERWIKWSYKGRNIQNAFAQWFENDKGATPRIVSVSKMRCLRKVRIDPHSGKLTEVVSKKNVERGGNLEVTELKVGADAYCSVAFEAFPDDSAMHADFTRFVNAFLEHLKNTTLLDSNSMSYPNWLQTISQ